MRRLVALMLMGAAVLSCSEPFEPKHEDMYLPLGLLFDAPSGDEDPMFADATDPPTIRVHGGRVVVLGRPHLSHGCVDYGGEISQVGGVIELRVEFDTPTPMPGCHAASQEYPYRAAIAVPGGSYELRVRHREDGEVVFSLDTAVVVPAG
jgi:hypothetical protein